MKQLVNLIFEPKGKYDPDLNYSIKDTVMSEDGSKVYFALQDVPAGTPLDDDTYWKLQIDLSSSKIAIDEAIAAYGDHVKQIGLRLKGETVNAVGNPVTFLPDAGSLLQPVTVLEPIQAGSGDPSPENIRPIGGHTSITLNHHGEDAENTLNTYTVEIGQTIYGGRMDWLTGVLTVDRAIVTLNGSDSEKWKVASTQPVEDMVRYDGTIAGLPETNSIACICSHFPHAGSNKYGAWFLSTATGGVEPRIICGMKTLDEFKAYLSAQAGAGTPVQMVYALKTPFEIQFTPHIIAASDPEQTNTLYGDGEIEVAYIKPLHVSVADNSLDVPDDKIAEAIDKYLEENPIEGGAVDSVNGKTGAVVLTAEDVGALPNDTVIPDTSEFITRAVNDLENYYLKSQTYTRDEIDQRVSAIPKFAIAVVSALPSDGISETTIYLVPGGADDNLYTEYIYVDGSWEILGSQRVDLTGYATQSWTSEQLAGYQPKGDYALKSELPTVPTKISAFENDAEYVTETELEGKGFLPEYVEEEIEDTASRLNAKALLGNVAIIGFSTDQHVSKWADMQESTNTPGTLLGLKALRRMMEMFPFNAVVFGGDYASGSAASINEGVYMVYAPLTGAACPVMGTAGNHDSWQDQEDVTNAQIFKRHAARAKVNYPSFVPLDKISANGYYDDPTVNIRYIILDGEPRNTSYSTNTTATITANLTAMLDGVPEDYKAIIFSHKPLNSSLSSSFKDAVDNSSVLEANKAKIICCFNGHGHTDASEKLNGVLYIQTRAAAPTDYSGVADLSTVGTADETAFDMFVIDQEGGKIYSVRYGAGADRSFSIPVAEPTNQIPISTDTDGSIYNDIGYKTGCRINSSGVLKENESAYAVTGFIPFKSGDIAYISPDVFEGNPGSCVISGFNADKVFMTNASSYVNNSYGAIVTENDGSYSFDITRVTSGLSNWANMAYIRVTGVASMSSASIVTVNEKIT